MCECFPLLLIRLPFLLYIISSVPSIVTFLNMPYLLFFFLLHSRAIKNAKYVTCMSRKYLLGLKFRIYIVLKYFL